MPASGVEAAIQELEQDVQRVQEAIAVLKKIRAHRSWQGVNGKSSNGNRLSEEGRRRISEAAKKRWAAVRAAKKRR